jgi:hypothetical protein
MENWLQELLIKWRSEGVKLNPPASVAEIENAETVLDFKQRILKPFICRLTGLLIFICRKSSLLCGQLQKLSILL